MEIWISRLGILTRRVAYVANRELMVADQVTVIIFYSFVQTTAFFWLAPTYGTATANVQPKPEHTDHNTTSYSWRGCVQDYCPTWCNYLDSDHGLVCTKLVLCLGSHQTSQSQRIDTSKLAATSVVTKC